MMAHACNSSYSGAEPRGLQIQGLSGLQSKSRASLDNIVKSGREKMGVCCVKKGRKEGMKEGK